MLNPSVHAVVLAAGLGRRMGATKQLADTRGVPMLRRSAIALASTSVDHVTVVVPPAVAVQDALRDLDVNVVTNPAPERGIMSSLKVGLATLPKALTPYEGVMIVLGDQPLVTTKDYELLLRAFRDASGACLIRPTYVGLPGHPVIIPRDLVPEIVARPDEDKGAAFLFMRHPDRVREVCMATDGVVFDVDTPQDLAVLSHRLAALESGT